MVPRWTGARTLFEELLKRRTATARSATGCPLGDDLENHRVLPVRPAPGPGNCAVVSRREARNASVAIARPRRSTAEL